MLPFELRGIAGGDIEQVAWLMFARSRANLFRGEDSGSGGRMVMGTENAHRDFVGGTLAQKAGLRHFQQRFVEPLVLLGLVIIHIPDVGYWNRDAIRAQG